MLRFMSSAASSSSGRAERAAAAGSAEQPHTPPHLKILSIHDVQRWLAEEPIASCSSTDAHRIREAGAVLSHRKPTREALQPLLHKWKVTKRKDQKDRPLGERLQEFEDKVIDAAQKLHP